MQTTIPSVWKWAGSHFQCLIVRAVLWLLCVRAKYCQVARLKPVGYEYVGSLGSVGCGKLRRFWILPAFVRLFTAFCSIYGWPVPLHAFARLCTWCDQGEKCWVALMHENHSKPCGHNCWKKLEYIFTLFLGQVTAMKQNDKLFTHKHVLHVRSRPSVPAFFVFKVRHVAP